ncbi:hypothetical protein [Cytobacillus praedii]|nr:hypothetical protein [Cytobacillus praedii]
MYSREIIKLYACPEIMQAAVNKYVSKCPEATVLSAQKTPFIDKADIMSALHLALR